MGQGFPRGVLRRYNKPMPGRLFLTRSPESLAAEVGSALPAGAGWPPRRNIAPGQEVPVLTATGLEVMRWGMIPVGRVNARGRPVMETIVNARSETLFDKSAFTGTGRGVLLADGWYEWTGKNGRKQAWRITPLDGRLLAFAAIIDFWTAPGGRSVPQVAAVTCAPNADVAAVHDRMGVILDPQDWARWLAAPEADARALLRVPPPGRLRVEPADDVDWSAP